MKKLLLGALLLLLSISAFAQETFVRRYKEAEAVINYERQGRKDVMVSVVFNPGDRREVVFHYSNGTTRNYFQTTSMEKGETENGSSYQFIECLDEDNKSVAIQLFDKLGVLRILIEDGLYVEFYE